MGNVKSTCLRFNLGKEPYRAAWANLQNIERFGLRSYNEAIAVAVNEYFERHDRLENDPYFENREREEKFVVQIISAVESGLEKVLPGFLAACLIKISQPYDTGDLSFRQPEKESYADITKEPENSDIDWDFLGG